MNKESDIYNLNQSLYHHKNILRTVACNRLGLVVTGSFDKTCAFFSIIDETGLYTHIKDTNYHDDYVYVVRPEFNDKGFLSGSKDAKIILMDNEGNPMGEYIGHTGTVCDISQSENATFISGSWDTTARVWDVNTQKCLYMLKDHAYAVTCLALENKRYVTGSQDKRLRFWDKDKNVITIDNAHDDIIRHIILAKDGNSIYTASNDQLIKQWTLDGQLIDTLSGHDGFIFHLATNPDMLFSAGDDRVVKTWKDSQHHQDIFHPNTVWDLAINPVNNDLITACADGVIRVFGNNPDRWIPQNEIDDYINLCLFSNNKEEENSNEQVDVSKLPLISEMNSMTNSKEGEIRVFNNSGSAEAYVFKKDVNKWEKIGDVLGTKQDQKFYPGDKVFAAGNYDFIFDVDLEGATSKLPFNKGGNALTTAEGFINREGLHQMYIDDITKFIRANAREQPAKTANTTTNKKKPDLVKATGGLAHDYFPKAMFNKYDGVNGEGPLKKIIELNVNLNSTNDPKALTNKQIEALKVFINTITKSQFYHTSTFDENQLTIFFKIIAHWPIDSIIPYLDLFRMYLLHPRSNDLFMKIGGGVQEYTLMMEVFKNGAEIHKVLILRVLNNLFLNESSRGFVYDRRQEILEKVSEHLDSENKNIRNGIIGLLFK